MAFCEALECWQLAEASTNSCKDHAHGKLDLSGLSSVKLHHRSAPSGDFSKAVALTQTAINNLGGPIHASMIDHKPVDIALAQALTQNAISHQGEKSADPEKIPADRAIAEALTLNAIAHQPQDKLKLTGRRGSFDTGLTPEQQGALLEEAKAERDRQAAAHVFGGGDPKEVMSGILEEINQQGGIVAVPSEKVPDENITLNQIKTLAQINALQEHAPTLNHQEEPVDHALLQARTMMAASSETAKAALHHTEEPLDLTLAQSKVVYSIDHLGEPQLKHDEHKIADASLAHSQTLYAIGHHRQQSLPSDKVPVDKALVEALTLNALDSEVPKSHLKAVEHPQEGLNAEQLASLQEAAKQEKEGEAAEAVPVIHMPSGAQE